MAGLDFVLNTKLAAKGLRPSDGVDDMTHISNIDVEGINENLLTRYKKDKIYTYSGTILIAVNPYKFLPVYESTVVEQYTGKKLGDLAPHVFAVAEAALHNVKRSDKNQSCVISGESGAGKTETTKFILQYLCAVTSSTTQWVEQQILEANTILEAFGNARTVRNDNSSRFGKFIQVCFNDSFNIQGAIIQEYLLEQSRITFQAPDERNYHVFYQLVKGGDKSKFLLDDIKSYSYLNQSGCYTLSDVDDAKSFESLVMALTVMNIDEEVQDGIFGLVSSVLHIGNIQFKDHDGERVSLTSADQQCVAKVAKLIKISEQHLTEVLTQRQIIVRGTTTTIPFNMLDAKENRNAMAKALYSRTFTWLVEQINSTTNPGSHVQKFIGVLDIFGFENFKLNSFEQLCINFTNEKLHKFFNHYVFALEQAEYTKEGINFSHISFTDNTACLELIEKPPKCVLRLLDEECRFPKGTDQSFLAKLHEALETLPHYVKGENKSKWNEQFGVAHYAGTVTYAITGFLEKNKDVMQDQLFEYMRQSPQPFIKDLTRFQDLLGHERRMIVGKKQSTASLDMSPTKDLSINSKRMSMSSSDENTRTNKTKPTVGDTFRKQLQALVEVLDTTNPWYVRCIKPNPAKSASQWEKDLVLDQLRYSGMLDIIRIRREGFPIHVPVEDFVNRYRVLAVLQKIKLSKDNHEACRQLMKGIKVPDTEWQVGKTKIFLRYTVYDPLEDQVRVLLMKFVVRIQATWRGFAQKRKYKETRAALVKIQAFVRGAMHRLRFLHKKRAAIRIQAAVRGWRAREVVREIRRRRKAEEERRKKEEQERREREVKEKGDQMMEDSFLSAQRELLAMAKMAEMKANEVIHVQKGAEKTSLDLDTMFKFLGEDMHDHKGEDAFLKQINNELDAMFAQAPVPTKPDGARTIARKKRVETQITGQRPEDIVDPVQFAMAKFAEKYFNNYPKSGTGTLKRNMKPEDMMPKDEMITYTKNPTIPTSLIHMHNPENVNLACLIFKDLSKYIRGEMKPEQVIVSLQSILAHCLERDEIRDEVYCQCIKQATNNPKPDSQARAWQVIALCCATFPPGKVFYKYLQAYIKINLNDSVIGPIARWSLDTVHRVRMNGLRKFAPSTTEINAINSLQDLVIRFYFLDGKAKAVSVHPSSTAVDVIDTLSKKINLQDNDGWALFESTPEAEHFIRGNEYIGDILSQWELTGRSSMKMTQYQTMSRKGHSAAMGGGDAKFVFRKRLFKKPGELTQDPVEYSLLYAQAVHRVVRMDEFPVNEKVALQLAGLQAQVLWGDADAAKMSRYDEPENYLPVRIRGDKGKDHWMKALFEAHRNFGSGKTDLEAKVLYLTAVKHYPLYGGTFFEAQYKGFWSYPAKIWLTIHHDGFKFVNFKSKELLAEHSFNNLKNMEVNANDGTLTFNLNLSTPDGISAFQFYCPRAEDVANLVASYSPAHRNWHQVGVANVMRKVNSHDERERCLNELRVIRKRIAEGALLKTPTQENKGFLVTTLRRVGSKSKIEKGEEYEKIFDAKYWSYSKIKITQPITNMPVESEELALLVFELILYYSGLASASPVALEQDDAERNGAIQYVISRCLEKEEICNDAYMQLIKQTTDQPDPNGPINQANWRFLSILSGVVVPRNPHILEYLRAHLRRCALDYDTEEGKYAQFTQTALSRTMENKNRKYPPSVQEIKCVGKCSLIYNRFYFMDGEFRALMFDAAATTSEVVGMIKERIGLHADVMGYSIFEVFGALERNMLAREKVADAMYKWEKYALNTHSPKQLQLTFKKRLFLGPFEIPKSQVEFDLVFHQAVDDVRGDRFPITDKEGSLIAALRAQVELGDLAPNANIATMYQKVMERCLPTYMQSMVQPEDIAAEHKKLKGLSKQECNSRFLKFVFSWPLYGSTVFEVMQSYTNSLPKNLWLAVNEKGIHIMRRRSKDALVFYPYQAIVNYSPSLRNLMILTESLTRGTKFVFNTSQASQIAHLMKDYTHIIIQRKQTGKVNSDPMFLEAEEQPDSPQKRP